jgi:acetoin:2,6-dichlorophenolindophenol oxidoreductase subunit beta
MSKDVMTYAQAINQAMHQAMEQSSEVICYGLGVNDPKAIFGTTQGLCERFGMSRVFDMPTSENAMLGVGVGAAINGLKPVMVHQRLDFFLLAMDQLVNSAAKWFYMFGGQQSVPITIRLILGRGWGQGPTHSQSLQAWFAHVPGLKVVMPSTPSDAKGMLLESIFDPNPVVFLEHRWLHHQLGDVEQIDTFRVPLDKAKLIRSGNDITIIAMSYQVVEAIRACELLAKHNIDVELIDLRSIQPIDWPTIFSSVRKTGRMLAVDTAMGTGSVASEIVARVSSDCFAALKGAPQRLTMPDLPEPTSYALTKNYYHGSFEIAELAHRMCLSETPSDEYASLKVQGHHDVPGEWFRGPF